MSLTRTNRWLTSLHVKDTFVSEPTDADILRSAKVIVSQLEKIQESFEEIIRNHCSYFDFDIILDSFRFIVHGIEQNYHYSEFDTLSGWHSWTDVFNEYMNMLYDMANTRVAVEKQKGFEAGIYKFIWIQ